MSEGNSKPDVVEGSFRNVESTRKPDIEINQAAPNTTQTPKKNLIERLFGRKSDLEKAADAVKKAHSTADRAGSQITRMDAHLQIDNNIRDKEFANARNKMQETLGPDPTKSQELQDQLDELKRKKGLL